MVKEKDLTNLQQVRFPDGDSISFEGLQALLTEAAENIGIPVAFGYNQIQSGSLMAKTIADCLTLYHPAHQKDYNYYLFTISRQGKYAFVDVWSGGSSTIAAAQFAKDNLLDMAAGNLNAFGKGQVVGSLIRGVTGGGLFASASKKREEENWYTIVNDIVNDILGV